MDATTARYDRVAITLHWVIAAGMIANIVMGLTADSLPEGWIRPVIDTHKSVGITVLGLAGLRLLWRVTHAPPPLPARYPAWERTLSHMAHAALYALIFAMPLTGWMHDSAWKDAASHPLHLFGAIPFPRIGWIMALSAEDKERLHDLFGGWHAWLGYALDALVALHLAGALKHQFVDREKELERMGVRTGA